MEWLIRTRETSGMSQEQVAGSCKITRQYYNFIENGRRSPSPKIAKRIAAVLGFDWTKFYEDGQEDGQAFFEGKRA